MGKSGVPAGIIVLIVFLLLVAFAAAAAAIFYVYRKRYGGSFPFFPINKAPQYAESTALDDDLLQERDAEEIDDSVISNLKSQKKGGVCI